MRSFFVLLAAVGLSTVAFAGGSRAESGWWEPPDDRSAAAPQEGDKSPLMVSLTEMKWVDLPERKGMQYALITGDPKTGPYTQMRKVPAGTDNPLHAHSSELTNVIISGVWYTGTDAASAKDFGPGSIVRMPADWVHVSGCRPGSDCVFYQEGKGRFDFKPAEGKASGMKPGT